MKKVILSIITLIQFVIFFNLTLSYSQKKSENTFSEIKEKECIYSQFYRKPTKLNFVFTATEDHSNYYFSDLKEQIYKIFPEKGISIVFMNGIDYGPYVLLKIDNSRVVDENEEYNKEIRYELEGMYAENANSQPLLSFKVVVKTIHDINQSNKKVAEYIHQKVMRL